MEGWHGEWPHDPGLVPRRHWILFNVLVRHPIQRQFPHHETLLSGYSLSPNCLASSLLTAANPEAEKNADTVISAYDSSGAVISSLSFINNFCCSSQQPQIEFANRLIRIFWLILDTLSKTIYQVFTLLLFYLCFTLWGNIVCDAAGHEMADSSLKCNGLVVQV